MEHWGESLGGMEFSFTTGNRGMAVCFAGALGGFFTLMILPAHLIEPCVELSVFLRGVYSVFSIYREG